MIYHILMYVATVILSRARKSLTIAPLEYGESFATSL